MKLVATAIPVILAINGPSIFISNAVSMQNSKAPNTTHPLNRAK